MNLAEARASVRAAGGVELCERLEHLDRVRSGARAAAPVTRPPDRGAQPDFDVVIAGGGLSLLYAPILAAAGLRVAVIDRARIGEAHREWNASRPELEVLVEAGIVDRERLDQELIVARYRGGVCRWHGGGEYPVAGVLDCAVDAGALLRAARARAVELGVTLIERTSVLAMASGPDAVAVKLDGADGSTSLCSRVVVDARGAASPYAAQADLVCPTVGGTLVGLDEGHHPRAIRRDEGEILATTEGIEDGRQHLWEAFPGRAGETTIYLFYYARSGPEEGTLMRLYARFFERISSYKQGPARLLRPTFGFIPGWSRLGPAPVPGDPRVVLVGDAAARHSPLTFCGFGATLRSLRPASERIVRLAERGGRAPLAVDDAPVHAGTGALALMLASPPSGPRNAGELNGLLDCAFRTLHGMGNEAYASLLRDQMSVRDFAAFLHRTSLERPSVYVEVTRVLGLVNTLRWAGQLGIRLLHGGPRSWQQS